ncbi:CHAT domain-containing protein [Fusarium sp. LHS14.1]|nr:CHAT domain-containing protein [Fusarium sp. LHS14.1]
MEGLQRATDALRKMLENVAMNDEVRISTLNRLSQHLNEQFMTTEDIKDLDEAVKARREALALVHPEDHFNRALQSHLLSNDLADRFPETEDLNDIEEAIDWGLQALKLTPEQHGSPRIEYLRRLELMFEEKYEETKDLADFDEIIRYKRLALESTNPDDSTQRAVRLTALGSWLDKRSDITGQVSDVNECIQIMRQVLELKPGNESALKNLIQVLHNRYSLNKKIPDLEECIRLHRQTTDSSCTDESRVGWMMRLANFLGELHERTEEETYLGEAFVIATEALDLVPEDRWEPRWLHYLGRLFGCRYLETEALADLEEAIRLDRLVLKHTPTGNDRSGILTNLGNRLGDKYVRTEEIADINEAIECARESLLLRPENPERLYNVAIKLGDRFQRTKEVEDVDEAIELERQALKIIPLDSSERADYLNILGNQLSDRFDHKGDLPNLEEAIRTAEEALGLMSEDHPNRAAWLKGLAGRLLDLYKTKGRKLDLENSIAQYELAVRHKKSAPEDRIEAAQAIIANCSDIQQVYEAARLAVSLVPKLVLWSHENLDRQYVLSKVVGLASDAAAAALQAKQSPMVALQLLEQGRGIIGTSLQDMRSDMQDLAKHHPHLAERYRALQMELDRRAEQNTTGAVRKQPQASINRRHTAAKAFTELTAEIRKLPGYQDFMLPHNEDEIYKASERGPIVVVNVSRLRCDALLVSDNRVRALALPNVTLEELKHRTTFWSLASPKTLQWLWDNVASPILDALGFTETPPPGKWPHIWWIPTGPLVQLPLHAAGYHGQQWSNAVLDRVLSSYGSSIRNLISGRRGSIQPSDSDQALLVAMEDTPGHDLLAFAPKEVDSVSGIIQSMKLRPIVLGRAKQDVTKQDVTRYLPDCKIFHFAGHGFAHAEDPLQSCLLLKDWEKNSLKVSDLLDMNIRQKAPFLAYLSACGTGQIKDETVFDENINLISACQITGFRHVIGTLWNVKDDLSVQIAKMTYQELRDSDISDESICRGLHKATRELRGKWMEQYKSCQSPASPATTDCQDTTNGSLVRSVRDASLIECEDLDLGIAYWAPYVHYGV